MTAQVLERPRAAAILAGPWVPLAGHEDLLATLEGWLAGTDRGLAVVGGATGSGKSRHVRRLAERVATPGRLVGVVPDEGGRRTDAHLLRAAIAALGGSPAGRTGLELTTELRALLAGHAGDPLPPVLLVDHADFGGPQLEIVRNVLAARNGEPATPLQLVLYGPPELADRIARRRALAGFVRLVAGFPPLDAYATHNLLNALETGPAFTAEAVAAIALASDGVAGRAIGLGEAAAREAMATGRPVVDGELARRVAATLDSAEPVDGTGVVQTRLALPGLEPGGSGPRRRRAS